MVAVLAMQKAQQWTSSLAGEWVQPREQTSSMWKHECGLLPWVPQLQLVLTFDA